jgi:hypothetical protein
MLPTVSARHSSIHMPRRYYRQACTCEPTRSLGTRSCLRAQATPGLTIASSSGRERGNDFAARQNRTCANVCYCRDEVVVMSATVNVADMTTRDALSSSDDLVLRLASSAYLARFTGRSRVH